MRLTHKIFVLAAALAVLATPAAAQNVVGTWSGKLTLDMSKIPKPKTPQQKQMMDAGIAAMKKMKFSLNLKANKTYVLTVTGVMPGMTPDGKGGPQTNEGTWKQSGNTVTIVSTKDNGKATKDKSPKPMTVSKDGRTMTLVPPSGAGGGAKIVFSR